MDDYDNVTGQDYETLWDIMGQELVREQRA